MYASEPFMVKLFATKLVKLLTTTRGKFTALWVGIIALFTLYGFFGPGLRNQIHGSPFDWKYALGALVSHMALGFCIATCLVVGVIICIEVRLHDAERKPAILTLVASSTASTVVPTLVLICCGLFHGKSGLILSEALLAATISLLSFLTFAGFVLSVGKR
jgi:hypothetical protein